MPNVLAILLTPLSLSLIHSLSPPLSLSPSLPHSPLSFSLNSSEDDGV